MSSRRRGLCVVMGMGLTGLVVGGCADQRWSPTERAMVDADAHNLQVARDSGGRQTQVVLAEDRFGAIANSPVSFNGLPNGTATASVDTDSSK